MNPAKIGKSPGPVKRRKLNRKPANQPGGAALQAVPAGAREEGVKVTYGSAKKFLQGAFAGYFVRLRAKSALADDVAGAAKYGIGLSSGAATILSAKVFERMLDRKDDPTPIGLGEANQLSMTLLRLRSGTEGSLLAEARLLLLEQTMRHRELDLVKTAIAHAKEIKAAVGDRSVDSAARMERVRKILFGERPADWTPITVDGDAHQELNDATPEPGDAAAPIPSAPAASRGRTRPPKPRRRRTNRKS
jgi:hypothetical protein